MMYNFKKYIVLLILTMCSVLSFGELPQAPNTVITENPDRVVTTVNALKNRDHGELGITVNKINIEEITGVENDEGEIEFSLIKNKKNDSYREEIKVVKNIEKISKNNRKKRSLDDNNEIHFNMEIKDERDIVKIKKNQLTDDTYIIKLKNNRISKVYKGNIENIETFSNKPVIKQKDINIVAYSNKDNTIKSGSIVIGGMINGGCRIFDNKWWLDDLEGGHKGKEYILKKAGNIKDKIKIIQDRCFDVQGKLAHWRVQAHRIEYLERNGKGEIKPRGDGGYVIEDVTAIVNASTEGYKSLRYASDIDVKLYYDIPSVQSDYLKKGGVFFIDNLYDEIRILDMAGGEGHLTRANVPSSIEVLVKRNPITDTINIKKEQLDEQNKISFEKSQIMEKFGYTSTTYTRYSVVEGSEFGITLTDQGIHFPKNLLSGTYKIKVKWNGSDSLFNWNNPGYPATSEINGEGDTLIIKYDAQNEVNIGEFIFKIDRRLYELGKELSWIYPSGKMSRAIADMPTDSYPRLVNTINRLENLNSELIKEVLEVEGRPRKGGSQTSPYLGINYTNFLTQNGYQDEISIPFGIPLNELNKALLVSRNNKLFLDNKFKLLGENNNIYLGNIKEEYIGEKAIITNGSVNLNILNLGDWNSWNGEIKTGEISSTNGTTGKRTKLNVDGKLFDWKSSVDRNYNHILTKLEVISSKDGKKEKININEGEKIQVDFEDNSIGIDGNGLFIVKKSNSYEPITYEIKGYYKDIFLGGLNLSVLNANLENIDIGEITFRMDKRLKNIKNSEIIYQNGNLYHHMGENNFRGNYQKFVKIENNLRTSSLNFNILENDISVTNKGNGGVYTSEENSKSYKHFISLNSATGIDNIYIPFNINISEFHKYIVVSKYNSNSQAKKIDNYFSIMKENKKYLGNIVELYEGEEVLNGKAKLDLTNAKINDWGSWNQICLSGKLKNNHGTIKNIDLNIYEGKLFNWKSVLDLQGNHIVTKLEVNGQIGMIGKDNKIQVDLDNNSVGIDNNGLFVIKKNYSSEQVYMIKAYYNDILLGTLELAVNNGIKKEYSAKIHYDIPLIVKGGSSSYYGWNVIYPISSSNNSAMGGIVDVSDKLIEDNRKNNQFKALKFDGQTSSLKSDDLGKKIKMSIGEKTIEETLYWEDSNVMAPKVFNTPGLDISLDYQETTSHNGALYFAFSNWDKNSKNITLKVEFPDRINEYNIVIPDFNGKNYYKDNPPDYLAGNFERSSTGEIYFTFDVESKDYDISILEEGIRKENLAIKIPKKITLKAIDSNGTTLDIPFSTEIYNEDLLGKREETDQYWYIYAPNNGVNGNSSIKAKIKLKSLLRNIIGNTTIRFEGDNLNLVSIGANTPFGEKYSTIVDKVRLKLQLNNFSEEIDIRKQDLGDSISSFFTYENKFQDENLLVLKDRNKVIFEKTFNELANNYVEVEEAGIKLKYNSSSNKGFEIVKLKGINYDKTLKLEVYSKQQRDKKLLLFYIDFHIINDLGFEILPGKGKLDFGDFFPGDIKYADTLIEFKNINGSKIKVDLDPSNKNEIYKIGASVVENTTIKLDDLKIRNLEKVSKNRNRFKISGVAKTTPNTLAGDYRGDLKVVITIIP